MAYNRPMAAVVNLESVVKSYDGHRAIDGLTLEVPEGSIFGLLGRNGAGKTTTIRMIMDIIRPDSGGIRVFEKPMEEPSLGGVWESNINLLFPSDMRSKSGFGYPFKSWICKVYKEKE